MNWTTKRKSLQTSLVTAHADARPTPVRGRAPAVREITFTPSELFGAMARCSHLHVVDPTVVSHESEIYRNLVGQHVDEDKAPFAILATADRLKDYSARHMTGVVGDGLAYLQMVRDGYEWFDHFENLPITGSSGTTRSPDFVFSRRDDRTVALSESKATRGSSREKFNRTVSKAYSEQVSPYLGLKLGSSIVSHGFAIGSYMTSNVRAELLIHHTSSDGSEDSRDYDGDPSSVRKGNYLNIISLLFGADASTLARSGSWSVRDRRLPTTRWLGRDWLIGYQNRYGAYLWPEEEFLYWFRRPYLPPRFVGASRFALDLEVAKAVFRALEQPEAAAGLLDNIPEMGSDLIEDARQSGGAVFPDGFAVLADDPHPENITIRPVHLTTNEIEIAEEVATPTKGEPLAHEYVYEAQSIQDRSEEQHLLRIRVTE
ncbi:hypothetical protein G6L08_22800 [Agrobacterium rhizogenes]|nr:hypothetical protein [Rhizobium rhizogenes]